MWIRLVVIFFGIDKWIDEAAEIRKRYFQGKFEVGKGTVLKNDRT